MSLAEAEIRQRIDSVRAWYHQIPIQPGIVTPGINAAGETLRLLDLPEDCRGTRVLDLGTRDGYFAFELERRSADVLAVDYVSSEETGFKVAAELLGSKVTFLQENVYNLTPEKYGTFDIVLFLGLLYHLPDPVRALKIVRRLCRERLCLETYVMDTCLLLPDGTTAPLSELSPLLADIPLMQFYPGNSLGNDATNYWGPNMKCMEEMLRECKFDLLSRHLCRARAVFNCRTTENAGLDYLHSIAQGIVVTARA